MESNVGNSQAHNDGDQKHASKDEVDTRFHEGQANAHKANDSSMHLFPSLPENKLLICFNRGRTNNRQQACTRREGSYFLDKEMEMLWEN